MLVLALTAWTAAAPLATETEAEIPLVSTELVEPVEMGFEDESRFRRRNRLGGYGAIVSSVGLGLAATGGLIEFGATLWGGESSPLGVGMVVVGGTAVLTGPIMQSVGVLGAARILRDHRLEAKVWWAGVGIAGMVLSIPTFGAGYVAGTVLLAGQAQANRELFMRAYGRPPGRRVVATLAPMRLEQGAGLALTGVW